MTTLKDNPALQEKTMALDEALRIAAAHLQAEQWDAAEDLLQQLREQAPENGSVLNLCGLLHFRRGNFALAQADWAAALAEQAHLLAAWQNYGLLVSQNPASADLTLLRTALMHANWQEPQRVQVALTVLDWLQFNQHQPLPWLERLYQELALPWLDWAFAHDCYDLGLRLEARIHQDYLKALDTEAHARATYDQMLPSITQAAHKLAQQLPKVKPAPRSAGARPKIGYFLHSASMLAHVETLFDLLSTLRQQEQAPFEPVLFVYGGETDPRFSERCNALNIKVIRLDTGLAAQYGEHVLVRLGALRQQLKEQGISKLVWMCALPWLAFCASLGLGVPLVWYSLKYHILRLPGIDTYLTHGDGGLRQIHGETWQTFRLGGTWFDASLSAQAQQLRQNLQNYRLILGTLGREEKMLNPDFVESVAKILQAHPEAVYLWSGRSQPELVRSTFERYGVAGQTQFLGWVNTKLMAQVIDVYLDTFPAPSGYTLREAMAAGAATVFFASPDAAETGINGFIQRLLAGSGPEEDVTQARSIMQPSPEESLFVLTHTPAAYVAAAQRLIQDADWRQKVSAANRLWMQTFYGDNERMLQTHAQAILG